MSKKRGGLVGAMMWGDVPEESTQSVVGEQSLVATKSSSTRSVSERVKEIDPSKCRLWIFADRPEDEAEHSEDIARSFKDVEQLSPVIVRELSHDDEDYPSIEYEIIAGSVRWRAAIKAQVMLKAFVRVLTDKEALNVMLIENEQRKNISEFSRSLQISKVWLSGMFDSKVDLAKAHKMDASKVSRYLKVAEHKEVLINTFENNIKDVGLRQLYQTVVGVDGQEKGVVTAKPATKKQILGFSLSINKSGITTIKFPNKLSDEKIERIRAIMEEQD